jgi:hypothetical protein
MVDWNNAAVQDRRTVLISVIVTAPAQLREQLHHLSRAPGPKILC